MADVVLLDELGVPRTYSDVTTVIIPKDGGGFETFTSGAASSGKPPYLLNDGDEVDTLYFNIGYDAGTPLAYLTYDDSLTIAGYTLDACVLGLGNLFAVELTGIGYAGEYALIWYEENEDILEIIYSTAAVPAFSVTEAGWQMAEYTPASSVTVDYNAINEQFYTVMDFIVAQDSIAFGDFPDDPTGISVTLDFSGGDMSISASRWEVWNQISIFKPATLVPSAIAEGVEVAGISGTHVDRVWAAINKTLSGEFFSDSLSVAPYAYYGQSLITGVSYPECMYIDQAAFMNCSSLSTISFPKCSIIGSNAFRNCVSLLDASFPQCETIGSSAFSGCTNLVLSSSDAFPALTTAYGSAFGGVTIINLSRTMPNITLNVLTLYGANVYDTTFSNASVSNIYYQGNFYNCSFPNAIIDYEYRYISANSCFFSFSPTLGISHNSVFFGATIENASLSVVRMSRNAFAFAKLINVTFTQNFTNMTNYTTSGWSSAFYSASLSNVEFTALTSFYNSSWFSFVFRSAVLSGCRFLALSSIPFPAFSSSTNGANTQIYGSIFFSKLTSVWGSLFNYQANLTRFMAPVATVIGSSAFFQCSSMTVAYIPNASMISALAFYGCKNLAAVYLFGDSVATLQQSNAFAVTPIERYYSDIGAYGSIYVKESMVSAYKAATNWSLFSQRFVGCNDSDIELIEQLLGR